MKGGVGWTLTPGLEISSILITSTIDTISEVTLVSEMIPKLDPGLVDENPARDTLWVSGGFGL